VVIQYELETTGIRAITVRQYRVTDWRFHFGGTKCGCAFDENNAGIAVSSHFE
jgi:hypothetical protein